MWIALLACTSGPPETPDPPVDTVDTADTGPDTAPPCTGALFTPVDADPIDVSAELLSGEPLTLDTDGALHVCPGTWFAQLLIQADVVVTGDGAADTILSGGESHTVITVTQGALELRGVTLDRGAARGTANLASGGAIWCGPDTRVSVSDAVLSNNQAYDGGAVFARDGCHVRLVDTELVGNVVPDDGGAMRFESATAELIRVWVHDSQARDAGAAIFVESTVSITESVFSDNVATDTQGGAILAYWGALEIQDSQLVDNAANELGGALALFGDATLRDVEVRGNQAGRGGGIALYPEGATLVCQACAFSDNTPDDVQLRPGGSYQWGDQGDFVCDDGGCR